jgi:2-C-methyl-D-erythritol 4-phosphate cytidylyltransferase/2-C-methyl-D-erythritol 2,4-cyclodiphosphate synthase
VGDLEPFADAVIVAAGSSQRMGGRDKLDELIDGRSVLQRSVETVASARSVRGVVIVTAEARRDDLATREWFDRDAWQVVAGGQRRQDSVAAGVRATSAEVVLVHDAARPLVSASLVDAVAAAAREHGAAIPIVPVADSLRRVENGTITGIVSRDGLGAAQTPQGARRSLLAHALDARAAGSRTFTDEAEILAADGVPVAVVDGEAANLKITLPEDLARARALAGTQPATARVGFGVDVHPFGTELGLKLGGIEVEGAPRLHGHSDGDVVLHAITDGLLGAAGLPDIGRLVPPSDAASRGIDSAVIVARALAAAAGAGWRPSSVDVTVIGSRPKLGGRRLDAMADRVAVLLGLDRRAVALKAATGNLAGDEGAGRVIRATAAVTVVPR